MNSLVWFSLACVGLVKANCAFIDNMSCDIPDMWRNGQPMAAAEEAVCCKVVQAVRRKQLAEVKNLLPICFDSNSKCMQQTRRPRSRRPWWAIWERHQPHHRHASPHCIEKCMNDQCPWFDCCPGRDEIWQDNQLQDKLYDNNYNNFNFYCVPIGAVSNARCWKVILAWRGKQMAEVKNLLPMCWDSNPKCMQQTHDSDMCEFCIKQQCPQFFPPKPVINSTVELRGHAENKKMLDEDTTAIGSTVAAATGFFLGAAIVGFATFRRRVQVVELYDTFSSESS